MSISAWRRWHSRRAWLRWPLKLLLFSLGVLLVLYPKVWLLPEQYDRLRNLDALIDPDYAALAPLEAQVREKLPDDADAKAALQVVERVVYEHVPYAHDWVTWGVACYLPTVEEVFRMGREDCDGRAIVAASLLRRIGYEAWVVSDMLHAWVETPHSESMGPTSAEKTLVSAPDPSKTGGPTEVRITASAFRNLARGMAYGVAAFPLPRELIIFALLVGLTLHPRLSFWRGVSGVLMLWIALDLLRRVGREAALELTTASVALALFGAVLILAGWLTLAVKDPAPRDALPERPHG